MSKIDTKSSRPDAPREWVPQAAFLLASGLVLVLAVVLEIRGQRVIMPGVGLALPESCWLKRLTGLECPGCGLTRSMICLVHGNFLEAWDFNPGGYLFFLLIAAQVPYRIAQICRIHWGFRPWCLSDATLGIACLIAVVLLVQWIVRWWG